MQVTHTKTKWGKFRVAPLIFHATHVIPTQITVLSNFTNFLLLPKTIDLAGEMAGKI